MTLRRALFWAAYLPLGGTSLMLAFITVAFGWTVCRLDDVTDRLDAWSQRG